MRRRVPLWALCALVAACEVGKEGSGPEPLGASSLYDPVAINPSLCGAGAVPFPNNAFFADATNPPYNVTTDGTLNIPSTVSTAVAANLTDGFSTTASAFTDVLGVIDYASAADAVIIIEADTSPRILTPGIDYTIQPSIAIAQMSGTGGACAATQGRAAFAPISAQRSRILIEPLIPLNPSTNYLVAVTRQLKSADGVPALPADMFVVANSDTRICRLSTDAVASDPLCSDPAAPAYAATLTPALAAANATQLTTLEGLRRGLVRPSVAAFKYFHNTVLMQPAIADDDLVIAWSFTTQSTSATLATLDAITTAKSFAVADSTLDTGALGMPDTAHIWAGRLLAVPYYLNDAAGVNDFASQLDYWRNDGTVTTGPTAVVPPIVFDHDADPLTPSVPAPCTGAPFNFARPVSTTNCYRIPLANAADAGGTTRGSLEDLPVLITVPKTAKPGSGWPVVIFQHGISGHRGQMLPIGATLAGAGFVTIAIDLPLHGILAGDATFGTLRQAGFERTFDLDIAAAAAGNACLSAPTGDGAADPSGACFINLGSLATTRDNLRQAVADLIHLSKSLGDAGLDFDGSPGNDIDTGNIRFAGISLGGIVGTTLLGVDTGTSATTQDDNERISSASLSVPGGGLAKLLDASRTFGPAIAAGLAGGALPSPSAPEGSTGSGSPYEGTDTYETFVRFAQHLVDPGDPINFAVSANANHRLHMTMVENDTVVPNSALSTCLPGVVLPNPVVATANTNSATRLAACRAGGRLVGADTPATGGNMVALCPGIATVGACPVTAGQDQTLISGFLSGTEPLYGLMGLEVEGPITPPAQASFEDCTNGVDVLVHFAIGSHGSLLDPTASAATTAEMHRQTTAYLSSDGYTLVTGGCP